jgi:hypothetical protein
MSGQQDQSELDPELEQALQEWNELWEQFEASDVNRKFDLAERLVRHSDGFEPEHVFEFVNRLWEACETSKERVRYRDFLELMRSERADAVKPELARLQWRLLQAYLVEGDAPPPEEVAILPALFHQSPEVVGAALDMVMYHGEAEPLVEPMIEEWPGVRDDPELLGGKSEYAWTTITLAVGQAVQNDNDPEELFERLSEVVDPSRRDGIEELLAHANGSAQVDPDEVSVDVPDEMMDVATRVAAELWGELLEKGWSLSTATLAFQELEAFYRHLVEEDVPQLSLGRLAFSATAPGGFLRSTSDRQFRDGYREGIYVKVLGRWLDYLQRRRFLETDAYRNLFPEMPRDLAASVEPIVEASSDPLLAEGIRQAATDLGKRP